MAFGVWLVFTWPVFKVHPCCSVYRSVLDTFYGQIMSHCMGITFCFINQLMNSWVICFLKNFLLCIFYSLEYRPRSGIAGSHSN